MKANRYEVTDSTRRELGDTEIDAVAGADCGPQPTWTTTKHHYGHPDLTGVRVDDDHDH